MTKKELVAAIAKRRKVTKQSVMKSLGVVVDDVFDIISRELARGEEVQIIGFGTFEVKERKSREGRNPRTGERIEIPANKLPTFKAGATLKKAVQK